MAGRHLIWRLRWKINGNKKRIWEFLYQMSLVYKFVWYGKEKMLIWGLCITKGRESSLWFAFLHKTGVTECYWDSRYKINEGPRNYGDSLRLLCSFLRNLVQFELKFHLIDARVFISFVFSRKFLQKQNSVAIKIAKHVYSCEIKPKIPYESYYDFCFSIMNEHFSLPAMFPD